MTESVIYICFASLHRSADILSNW